MTPDIFNATFEGISALLCLINVRRVWIDKKVSGVSLIPILFFTVWGFWNVIYYPMLEQYYSAAMGLLLALTNSTWLGLAYYYTYKNKKENKCFTKTNKENLMT